MSPVDILLFWFTELSPKQHYAKDAALDEAIRARFGATLEAAARCELFAWRTTPEGRLAEVLVLDQFSRNVYRGTPQAFAQDALALALAQELVASGQDRSLPLAQRSFAYMPFMHSESALVHMGKPSLCLRSRVWKTPCASSNATKPSSSALAATPTATPSSDARPHLKSWFF